FIALGDENHGLTYKDISQFDARMGVTSMYIMKAVDTEEYGLIWTVASPWMSYDVADLLGVL
ncbi:MAG TPA: hypothetical protein PKY75_05770, partial [Defluviitoga tunisiensis]|nr:hypothetical protein [Defluviitoga tunisiensis]